MAVSCTYSTARLDHPVRSTAYTNCPGVDYTTVQPRVRHRRRGRERNSAITPDTYFVQARYVCWSWYMWATNAIARRVLGGCSHHAILSGHERIQPHPRTNSSHTEDIKSLRFSAGARTSTGVPAEVGALSQTKAV